MSRQTDARAKLAALSSTPAAASTSGAPSSPPARRAAPATRTAPIRMSVDWLPADHRRIKALCVDLAATLGRPSVPASDAVRAAVGLVLDDPALVGRLVDALAAGKGSL
jgi:hypothetical protein